MAFLRPGIPGGGVLARAALARPGSGGMATTQSVNHSLGANRDRCIPGARGVTRTAHGACWIALSVTSPSSRDESTGAPPTTTRSAWISSVTSSCGCARSSRLITRTEGRVSVSRLVPAASTARPRARAASIPRLRSPNDTGTPCTSRSVSSSAAAQPAASASTSMSSGSSSSAATTQGATDPGHVGRLTRTAAPAAVEVAISAVTCGHPLNLGPGSNAQSGSVRPQIRSTPV